MSPHSYPGADRVARNFRRIVSGDPSGQPAWVRAMADGEDAGLFGPGSPPWIVHGHLATLVGGIRALLLQALHPAALAGVEQHSRYRGDALGRLSGTTRWLTSVTFGDTATAERESARVRVMHDRVRGTWSPSVAPAVPRPYTASDPDLLRWVHVAFTDSFLTTHLTWGGPIPGGPDAYVRDWGRAAELLGLADPPRSRADLDEQLSSYEGVLVGGPAARRIARFVLRPPLPAPALPAYGVLVAGAVSTLRPAHRTALGLPHVPRAPARIAVSGLLAGMRLALGARSPSERAARGRIERVAGAASPDGLRSSYGAGTPRTTSRSSSHVSVSERGDATQCPPS
ncbi:MAG TPA: oxygenase MpaB family protein [Jiangellales bacterium]|nr:oxygenase MpaB family protein [Jiangellales bacterium]